MFGKWKKNRWQIGVSVSLWVGFVIDFYLLYGSCNAMKNHLATHSVWDTSIVEHCNLWQYFNMSHEHSDTKIVFIRRKKTGKKTWTKEQSAVEYNDLSSVLLSMKISMLLLQLLTMLHIDSTNLSNHCKLYVHLHIQIVSKSKEWSEEVKIVSQLISWVNRKRFFIQAFRHFVVKCKS